MAVRGAPRYHNGNLRRKYRARFQSMAAPCALCKGRLGPIHYDEPSDAKHPLSLAIDEIHPASRWKEAGYATPEACVDDWGNLQPTHWICNSRKSNRLITDISQLAPRRLPNPKDGDW